MKLEKMKLEIGIPEGIEVKLDFNMLTIKGPKGELNKEFRTNKIDFLIADNKITLFAKNATKNEKRMMGTFRAHIKNMLKGVTEGYVYKLKICSGHFPMNVAIKGNELSVKNFLGEKIARTVKIVEGTKVKIDGDIITVEGIDIEKCGQCAANIEKNTRVKNKDRRIFQDGIWIISKTTEI